MSWITVVSDLHICMCRLVHADIYIYIYILRVSLLCYDFFHLSLFPQLAPLVLTVDVEFGCEMATRCDTARKYIVYA